MTEPQTDTFAAWVRELRDRMGMTQWEFSNRINVQSTTVSRWERGVAVPAIPLIRHELESLGKRHAMPAMPKK